MEYARRYGCGSLAIGGRIGVKLRAARGPPKEYARRYGCGSLAIGGRIGVKLRVARGPSNRQFGRSEDG